MASKLTNLDDLRYFLEVVETENITRASERLGVTQPTLTQAIKRLESVIGVELLLRSRTGVQVTRAGRRLVVDAKRLLGEFDLLKRRIREENEEVKGAVTLGLHESVAQYSLPLFSEKLLKTHPGLELRLKHDLSRRVSEDIVSFRVDIGIVVNPFQHPELVIKKLCADKVTFWSKAGAPQDTLILNPELTQTQSLLRSIEKLDVSFQRTIETTSLEVAATLAESGCGIAILPTRVAERRGNALKLHKANWPVFSDSICLVYRKDMSNASAVRAVINAIADGFKET